MLDRIEIQQIVDTEKIHDLNVNQAINTQIRNKLFGFVMYNEQAFVRAYKNLFVFKIHFPHRPVVLWNRKLNTAEPSVFEEIYLSVESAYPKAGIGRFHYLPNLIVFPFFRINNIFYTIGSQQADTVFGAQPDSVTPIDENFSHSIARNAVYSIVIYCKLRQYLSRNHAE